MAARDWEALAPGVLRRRLPGWDATVGVVAGATKVLLIDSGSTLPEGARIAAQVRALLGRPVTDLALTHAHFDHVLGTASFPGARLHGPAGIGAALTEGREELREDAIRQGVPHRAAAKAAAALRAPDHLVADVHTLDLGDREVRLVNLGAAHSAQDLAVVVPGHPALVFCGDLVEESGPPQAGPDAHPAHWPAALDRLLDLGGEDARYVPGHGAVVDAAFVRRQRTELAHRFG
ncbi:MBL fold metallo-hydrolase [Streptomyces polyrhachis]|uniref:MBL fold metallo-hydrolase n=1 Tax=Streptomyces polyrhachis TaxID=1282885 RepID=A0ABW2GII1_9ACTN